MWKLGHAMNIAYCGACIFALALGVQAQEKPRVYITDSNSWETRGAVGGGGGAFAGSSAGGARPQTAEVIKTFGQRCPQVIINNRLDVTNYVVELEHEGGKGLLAHKDKVVVFVRATGDSIFSKSTLSVGGSVQDACEAITAHWTAHASELTSPLNATAAVGSPVAVNPASTPVANAPAIKVKLSVASVPAGADIEINGDYVGSTPSMIDVDSGTQEITVKKKGFHDWSRRIKVSGGSITVNAELEPDLAQSK